MEDYTRENTSTLFSMEVDETAKNTFIEMAKWTRFLAILGFIFLGLMVFGGIIGGLAISSMSSEYTSQLGALAGVGGIGIMLLYVRMAALMFYPTYALYKYSIGIKTALKINSKEKFNEAIAYLKGMFKFYGIFMIILFGLYAIIAVFAMLGVMGR